MNDYEPPYTKRYAHLKWLSNVAFLCDVLKFQMKKRTTGPTLIFVLKVPVDYSEKSELYTRELTQAIITINAQTPVAYHEADHVHLLNHIGYLVHFNSSLTIKSEQKRKRNRCCSTKFERNIVSLGLGDDSDEMLALNGEMAALVEFAAHSEDIDIVTDLRAMGNHNNSVFFDPF